MPEEARGQREIDSSVSSWGLGIGRSGGQGTTSRTERGHTFRRHDFGSSLRYLDGDMNCKTPYYVEKTNGKYHDENESERASERERERERERE